MYMLIIHTTTPSKKEAKHLTQLLLASRLVACVQRHKIKSAYIWQKNEKEVVCKENEYLLILKTLPEHYEAIQSLILSHHSYEVPEIIAFEAKAQNAYDAWIKQTLKA